MISFFGKDDRNKYLKDIRSQEEEASAQMLSKKYNIDYTDLSGIGINTDGLKLIPEEDSRIAKMAIFDAVGKKLKIAVLSPNQEDTQKELKKLEEKGYSFEIYMVSNKSLEKAWERYADISKSKESRRGVLEISNDEIVKLSKEIKNIDDLIKETKKVFELEKKFLVSRVVEILLAGALATNASDIHIEPEENNAKIRIRLDGVLVDVLDFKTEVYNLLLSRIKLLSGMKINIKDNSQDGRFTISIEETEIEIRSSVLPGAYGESIVMRILNPNAISIGMEELGISNKLLDILKAEIKKPNGMILNTGPTGSGKTTTLYAFLKDKQTPGIKIITIEDPIEYHLAGIVQTQTDPKKGYDFAKGLKSSLRQDPDIIMVGEIRERETAETAIHAALTGHLVFSTLHTNNAAGAFTRLIDLGINSKILTSAINVAIAQRLVRKLCSECKEEVEMSQDQELLLKNIYNSIKDPEIEFPNKIYKSKGCDKCNNTGYKGRIGVFEAILSDANIEKAVQSGSSEREIKESAKAQDILDMSQDGTIKILKGVTSIEEVERVVDLKNREGIDISE